MTASCSNDILWPGALNEHRFLVVEWQWSTYTRQNSKNWVDLLVNLDKIIMIKASWSGPEEDPIIQQPTTVIGGGLCRFMRSQSD